MRYIGSWVQWPVYLRPAVQSGRGILSHRPLWSGALLISIIVSCIVGCRPDVVSLESSRAVGHGDEMPELAPIELAAGELLSVVATTSLVADVVGQIGANRIDVTVLMPPGTDPHSFEPTPQDVVAVAGAHVIFVSGAGLEAFLQRLLDSAGEGVPAVPLSHGVELLQARSADEHEDQGGKDHDGADPHTWFDPTNVIIWAHNVEHALASLDPAGAATYAANAAAYEATLHDLDVWVRGETARIPEGRRKLVTDHASFTYFARRYGFQQTGAVFPGYSTLSEPSAQDIARLEDAIREHQVPAVFVGLTVSSDLAERISADTGTRIVYLYTGSLSEKGGPADTYLALMRYDVAAIVEALQ